MSTLILIIVTRILLYAGIAIVAVGGLSLLFVQARVKGTGQARWKKRCSTIIKVGFIVWAAGLIMLGLSVLSLFLT